VFDQNHDGTIDFHEFLLAVATATPGDLDGHLDYVFELWEYLSEILNILELFRCDVSGDGQMDIDELATFLSASVWFYISFSSNSILLQCTLILFYF